MFARPALDIVDIIDMTAEVNDLGLIQPDVSPRAIQTEMGHAPTTTYLRA